MPRNIPTAALQKLAQTTGLEPVNIIRIQWIKNGGYFYYADRNLQDYPYIQGKLLSIADLEAVLSIDKNTTSTSVQIKLDDTDNSIKTIFNTNDIHNRPAVIFQWFAEAEFSIDYMFPIFEGVIASPIEWDEGGRTMNFDIITKLEDREVGFSVEDGMFTNIPDILLGHAWPMVFGTVLDMPTLRMDDKPSGTTAVPLSIADYNILLHVSFLDCEASRQAGKAACLSLRAAELMFRALGSEPISEKSTSKSNKVSDQINTTSTSGGLVTTGIYTRRRSQTEAQQANTNKASENHDLQGLNQKAREDYKRGRQIQCQAYQMLNSVNTKTVPKMQELMQTFEHQKKYDTNIIPVINGHKFIQGTPIEIKINQATFTGSFQGDTFLVTSKRGPKDEQRDKDGKIINPVIPPVVPPQGITITADDCGSTSGGPGYFSEEGYWACEPPWHFTLCEDKKDEPAAKGEAWFAQAGAGVDVGANYPIRYILSITPGTTVLWLSARKSVNGIKVMTPIPPDYYVISNLVLGSVTALIATFSQPLSTREGEEWDEDVFATLQSSIGPNVVNIMIYLIQMYTPFGIDTVSFNHVRSMVAKYPANFALLEKKNVVELLSEIAFQSRCSIWLANEKFYLKYLPEQGQSVDTITENDIEVATMKITTTPTEDLVTKFIATWQASYAYSDKNKIIMTYNINKYGIRERTFDFYIYNNVELVQKSATFWLLRMSNMWKKLQCRCFLNKLKVETMDNVTVDLAHQSHAYVPVVGVCEKATLNTQEYSINMEVWLPVRIGEMYPYIFAYPAGIGIQYLYPTHDDIVGGFVNDNPQANGATGDLGGAQPSGQSGGSRSQSSPSDQFDSPENNNIPPISTTASGATPYSQTSEKPAAWQQKPNVLNYNFSVPERQDARVLNVPDNMAVPLTSNTYPGALTVKVEVTEEGNSVYQGYLFLDGIDLTETFLERVIVIGLDPDDELPNPTEGLITECPEYDDDGEIVYTYYFDPQTYVEPIQE